MFRNEVLNCFLLKTSPLQGQACGWGHSVLQTYFLVFFLFMVWFEGDVSAMSGVAADKTAGSVLW